MEKERTPYQVPEEIKEEVEIAMSYYPQLKETPIRFYIKDHIKHSTMQAQPTYGSFFRKREKREYIILISEQFKIKDKEFLTTHIPSDVLIGWIGHELGHLMDYQNRSNWNLLWFGLKYLLSDKHIVEAERAADTYAVQHGMHEYILKTKDFILNHAEITQTYKDRMRKYYLSPEEIMQLVEEHAEEEKVDNS
jgi:hypothetical protein